LVAAERVAITRLCGFKSNMVHQGAEAAIEAKRDGYAVLRRINQSI
jgi:hypothetical protein